ncbi:3665_t:CDS:2, partial [Ambispora leptoticha]
MDAYRNSSASTSTNYSKHQTVVNVTTTTTTAAAAPSPKFQRRSGPLIPKTEQIRKLVKQILSKLKKCKKPPSVFTTLPEYYKNTERGKNANSNLVSLLGSSVGTLGGGEEIIMDEHNVYSTDEICDLLIELRDVLVVCKLNGITFGDKVTVFPSPPDSPYSSREPSPTRSRSPSPTRSASSDAAILDRIIQVLGDIVQNDCRYKISMPRPLRPPNSLQIIALDVAFLLIDQNPYSPRWLYELGMTMLSAFIFFEDKLKGKLLSFYGRTLLPQLMACGGTAKNNFWVESGAELNNANNSNLGSNRENRGRIAEHKEKNLIKEHENTGHINITIQDSSKDGYDPPPPVSIEIHSPIDTDTQNQNRFQQQSQSQHQMMSIA